MDTHQELKKVNLDIQKNNQLFYSLIEDDSTFTYNVYLFCTKNKKIIPQSACIIMPSIFKEILWFDLSSFEVVHAISRCLMMIPDKLSTALQFKKENLPDPNDGTFFIDLVLDLIKHYKEKLIKNVSFLSHNFQQENLCDDEQNILIIKQNFLNLENYEHSINEKKINKVSNDEIEFITGFPMFFKYILNMLDKLKCILKTNDYEFYIQKSVIFLEKCDIILLVCNIYLDFIHPLLHRIKRGEFETLPIDEYKEITKKKFLKKINY